MGGTSLQFLLTFILLLLCMKPTTGNNLGLGDTHLGCKEHERRALLKIKQDLIDDYSHLSSWSTDQDCCKWSGVKCSNQTGHVIMLNLSVSFSFPSRPLRDVLDLSNNQLSGEIPSSLSHIDRLSVLDLSNNNLSEKIPAGLHLSTFNASSYEGNPYLCGAPLPKKCSGEEIAQNPAMNGSREHAGREDENEGFITLGFYVSVALGFITGFWGVVGTLLLNKSLRVAYFRFLTILKIGNM